MEIFRKLTTLFTSEKNVPDDKASGPLSIQDNSNLKDIENKLVPLVRNASILRLRDASRPHPDAALRSHFGGLPYFELGMKWPCGAAGVPLDFIFQVFTDSTTQLPQGIKLIQFFYDHNDFATQTDDSGWLVKIFTTLNPERQAHIARPAGLEQTYYCEFALEPGLSLPDWEGLQLYAPDISKALQRISAHDPWELYEQFCEKMTGCAFYQSQLGGYPRWVQGESTPVNSRGENVHLLFQIDSEDNAGLVWGDVGLVYVFYDETDDKVWFELQCY